MESIPFAMQFYTFASKKKDADIQLHFMEKKTKTFSKRDLKVFLTLAILLAGLSSLMTIALWTVREYLDASWCKWVTEFYGKYSYALYLVACISMAIITQKTSKARK